MLLCLYITCSSILPSMKKTSGSLFQYFKDIPAVDNNNAIANFTENNLTDSFSFKVKMTGQTGDDGTKNVEIMLPVAQVSTFWRTLQRSLKNSEIALILSWSANCVIVASNDANQNATFSIADTKLYVPVITLKTQYNSKLLQQLKSSFKRVINWNKHLSKPVLLAQNPNLNHLFETRIQGVNRLFVLAFENDTQRTSSKGYYLPNVEIEI